MYRTKLCLTTIVKELDPKSMLILLDPTKSNAELIVYIVWNPVSLAFLTVLHICPSVVGLSICKLVFLYMYHVVQY